MTYHAEIIAVGTELLLGNIANTDAQELSQALASVGVDVLYHTVVGDNPQRLEEAIAIARKRADLLIFTGGLGPTYDDLTKETVCRVLDVPLTFHPEAAQTSAATSTSSSAGRCRPAPCVRRSCRRGVRCSAIG